MLIYLSLLTAALSGPASSSSADSMTTRKRVDLIEFNHFFDEDGREVFQQVIFYDWCERRRQFHVRSWRLIKQDSQLPQRRWAPDRYECSWYDDGVLRQVWAPSLRETWTQTDPERVNRALLPEDRREPLFPPRGRPQAR